MEYFQLFGPNFLNFIQKFGGKSCKYAYFEFDEHFKIFLNIFLSWVEFN